MLKKVVRTVQNRFPELREAKNEVYHWSRSTFGLLHDRAFAVVGRLPRRADDLFLDVGANRGQSILSLRRMRPDTRIVSFEPNPTMVRWLESHFREDGLWRLEPFGLGARADRRTLFTPTYGRFAHDGLATFSREAARAYLSKDTLFGFDPARLTLAEQVCETRTLDSLGLRPTFIKIDVEGLEHEVLQGGEATIRACRPVLMVERFHHNPELEPLLRRLGYVEVRPDERSFVQGGTDEENMICMTPDTLAWVRDEAATADRRGRTGDRPMSLIRRVRKLAAQPAFKAEPLAVLWRGAALAAGLATGRLPTFRLTRAGGERMRAPADLRYTTITAVMLRDWVEPELRALDRLLSPGDVFIDVGANIGLYAIKGGRLVGPEGRVLALEPGAEAFDYLKANVALNGFDWVTPIKAAASDREGEAVLHHVPLGRDPQAFSLIANPRAVEGETVTITTLDALVEVEGLARLDLIKIDVEGAEPLVITGAERTLATLRPAVIFECNAHINAGGETGAAARTWDMLHARHYRFFRLMDGVFEPVATPPKDFCNLVAVHVERSAPFA